jgi:hypothetical protein
MRALVAVAFVALAFAQASAQLTTVGGSPIPSNPLYVPFPPGGAGSVIVKLPSAMGVRMRVPAHHGTEIYKLPVWSVSCPVRGRKRKVTSVNSVTNFERRGMVYALQTTDGTNEYPLSCRLAPIRGRFILVFYDPGHLRSPALSRGPDYTVP